MSLVAQTTVIIPTKNRFELLSEALQSITLQNAKLEVLLVDDSDQPGLDKVLEKFKSLDIKTIPGNKTKSIAAARNIGIQNAKYDLIAFLDSDDKWKAGHLEAAVHELNKSPELGGTICLSAPFFTGKFSFLEKLKIWVLNMIKNFLLCVSSITKNGKLDPSAPYLCQLSHMVFRKKALPSFPEEIKIADEWFVIMNLLKNSSIKIIPRALVGFRYSPTSYSFDQTKDLKERKRHWYQKLTQELVKSHPNSFFVKFFVFYTQKLVLG